jgi:hypothetical protein
MTSAASIGCRHCDGAFPESIEGPESLQQQIDFNTAISSIRSDIGVLSEAFGVPTRTGRQFKRLTLQPQLNSRLMAQAQQARETPGEITTIRGNGIITEFFTARLDRRFVCGSRGVDTSVAALQTVFGRNLNELIYGSGKTVQKLEKSCTVTAEQKGKRTEKTPPPTAETKAMNPKAASSKSTRTSRRKVEAPYDGRYPPCHQLLPLPALRKFDAIQPELAFRSRARPKLLLVDGNLLHLAACKIIFSKLFELVQAVSTADQALELMEHIHFDLCLVAADLPGFMSGVDLCDTIRRTESFGRTHSSVGRMIVVGMLTREQADDQGVIDACFIGGMDRFVLKPAILVSRLLKELVAGASSLDFFRRLTLETGWFSKHAQVTMALSPNDEHGSNSMQLITGSRGTEETLQNQVAADIEDREIQADVVDLHSRQRKEEHTTVLQATFHFRERIAQLEHEAYGLRSMLAHRTQTDAEKAKSLLGVETRLMTLEKQLHERKVYGETQKALADKYREDLRQMLRDGSANAEKVAQARQHAKAMTIRAEAAERLAMAAQDSVSWKAWYNYYGCIEQRNARHNYVPKRPKDPTASYFRDQLLHLLDGLRKQSIQVAKKVSSTAMQLRKLSANSKDSKDLAVIVGTQTMSMEERVSDDMATLQDHVDTAMANIMIRELDFWKMLENDDPRLREELAKLRAALTSWKCQTAPVHEEVQTDDWCEPFEGELLTSDQLLASEQSSVLGALVRRLPFFQDSRYLSPKEKMKFFGDFFDELLGIETKDRQRVFEATKELQTEVWRIAKRISDPERLVKLMAPLSRLTQQSYNAVVATLQNISENLDMIFSLGQKGVRSDAAGAPPQMPTSKTAAPKLSTEVSGKKPPINIQRKSVVVPPPAIVAPPAASPATSVQHPSEPSSLTASPTLLPTSPGKPAFERIPALAAEDSTLSRKASNASVALTDPPVLAASKQPKQQSSKMPERRASSLKPNPHQALPTPPVLPAASQPVVIAAPEKLPEKRVESKPPTPPPVTQRTPQPTPPPTKDIRHETPPLSILAVPSSPLVELETTAVTEDVPLTLSATLVPEVPSELPAFQRRSPTPPRAPAEPLIAQQPSAVPPDTPATPVSPPVVDLQGSTSIQSIGQALSISKSPLPAPIAVAAPSSTAQIPETAPPVDPIPPSRKLSTKPSSRGGRRRVSPPERIVSPPEHKKPEPVVDATVKVVELAFSEKPDQGNMRHKPETTETTNLNRQSSAVNVVPKQRNSLQNLQQLFGVSAPDPPQGPSVVIATHPRGREQPLSPTHPGSSGNEPTMMRSKDSFISDMNRRRSERPMSDPSAPAEQPRQSRGSTFSSAMSIERQKKSVVVADAPGGVSLRGSKTTSPPRDETGAMSSFVARRALDGAERTQQETLARKRSQQGINDTLQGIADNNSLVRTDERLLEISGDQGNAQWICGTATTSFEMAGNAHEEFTDVLPPSELDGSARDSWGPKVVQSQGVTVQETQPLTLPPLQNPREVKDSSSSGDLPSTQEKQNALSVTKPSRSGTKETLRNKEPLGLSAQHASFPLAPVAQVPFSVRASVMPGVHISSTSGGGEGGITPHTLLPIAPPSPPPPKLTAEQFPEPPFPWPKPRSTRLLPHSQNDAPRTL